MKGKGFKVYTGGFPNKHCHWLFQEPNDKQQSSRIDVPLRVIEQYRKDKERNLPEHYDILKMAANKKFKHPNSRNAVNLPHGAPIFYLTDDNDSSLVVAIGHTRFFRIPYKKKISDHIQPDDHDKKDITDFAEALFGKAAEWASRVFFEDARLVEGQNDIYLEETALQVLSSPKPTTFQHYLEQPNGTMTNMKQLAHWDDDTLIRGYKLYWHRQTPDDGSPLSWKASTITINQKNYEKFIDTVLKNKNGKNYRSVLLNTNDPKIKREKEKITIKKLFEDLPEEIKTELREYHAWKDSSFQHQVVKPVKKGVRFKSTIHFENLTCEELGALLFVLRLPDGCHHKLGLGKPLGLGSIRITPTLFLIDRKKRYEKLFDDQAHWYQATIKKTNVDVDEYIKRFENYVKTQLKNDTFTGSLWNHPRLKELQALLQWHDNDTSQEWIKKTRYLQIECHHRSFDCICTNRPNKNTCNEFKDRPVLPKPHEVSS